MFPRSAASDEANQAACFLADDAAQALLARRLVWVGLACLALALVALPVDLPVAQAFLCRPSPQWERVRQRMQDLVQPGETFAHGYGVLLVLGVIVAADAGRRRQWLRGGSVILWAGLFALALKAIIARARPHYFIDVDAGQFRGGVFDSFLGLFPLSGAGHAAQSIPSGHATTAVALAIALAHRWPQARWAFVGVASLSALQRVFVGSHYLSDCLAGAALACVTAALIYHPRLAGRWFNWYERGERPPAPLEWNSLSAPSAGYVPRRRAA